MLPHPSLTQICSQPRGEGTAGELRQEQMGHRPCRAQLSCLGSGAFVLLLLSPGPPQGQQERDRLLLLSPEPPQPGPAATATTLRASKRGSGCCCSPQSQQRGSGCSPLEALGQLEVPSLPSVAQEG